MLILIFDLFDEDDEILEEFYIVERGQNKDGTGYVEYRDVDEYWYKVMQLTDVRGKPKYPALANVVKMARSLSHVQADVERGFNVNKQLLNDRTLLNEQTIRATRTVKEVIAMHGSITKIPITSSLIAAYRKAHRAYKEALEKEQSKKPEVVRKRKA